MILTSVTHSSGHCVSCLESSIFFLPLGFVQVYSGKLLKKWTTKFSGDYTGSIEGQGKKPLW